MKKFFILLLSILIMFGITGCTKNPVTESNTDMPTNEHEESEPFSENSISTQFFNDQKSNIIYTDWSDSSLIKDNALNKDSLAANNQNLPLFKIDTEKDLENFKSTYKNVFTFDKSDGKSPSFNDVMSSYDKIFFDNNSLLVLYITANSSSYKFNIGNIHKDKETLLVNIEQINNPDVNTTDMAGWFVVIEFEDNIINKCNNFNAILNEIY